MKQKKLIVLCVGASPYEEEAYNEIVEHNMQSELSTFPVTIVVGFGILKPWISSIEAYASY